MKKIVKNFLDTIRIGSSAGKSLLFFWLKNDLKKIQSKVAADLGGGSMDNTKFFKSDKYICVDIDQSKLDIGKKANPNAIVINSKIQDFLKNYKLEENVDLLVCVQTIGTNKFFEHEESLSTIKQMYYFLEQGGSLIFNLGTYNTNLNKLEKQLNEFFYGKFESMKIKTYGAFHVTLKKDAHWTKKLFLVYLMNFFIPLRTLFGFRKKKIYIFCEKKI
tara:strand:+ start:188 stop:841 length:654 start_codon:yes stop_codon:yes gene_type:complete